MAFHRRTPKKRSLAHATNKAQTAKAAKTAGCAKPANMRELGGRRPWERMIRLHTLLAGGKFPNCRKLAEQFEVSEKTIQRDLDFMRDSLGTPLAYDRTRHGYYYTEPVSHFPGLEISEGEVIALLVAEKALAQHRGSVFEKPLRAACEKLSRCLQGSITVQWADLAAAVSFRQGGVSRIDAELFSSVSMAVKNSVEIEFSYHKLGSPKPEPRHVRPYHLTCIENQWYCIAHDLQRGALRSFVLPRMSGLRHTNTRFLRPHDFSIEDYLRESFGVFRSEKTDAPHQVRIRFDAFATRLIGERMWHESQEIAPLPEGECELRLRLTSLEEVERWVLSWGGHAKVIAPAQLKASVRAAARAILEG